MTRPRLLDLFCGAGGSARGYQLAGFHVTGVDIRPQPRYCGDAFHQADALTFPLDGFDVIHASPPCQLFSAGTNIRGTTDAHADLIAPVRARLVASGAEYVIENVVGAPLVHPITLCGTQFGLKVFRHRLFETSFSMLQPGHTKHPANATRTRVGYGRRDTTRPPLPYERERIDGYITVAGHLFNKAEGSAAMAIDWMTNAELSQAIPPAYTRFIGEQALRILQLEQGAVA